MRGARQEDVSLKRLVEKRWIQDTYLLGMTRRAFFRNVTMKQAVSFRGLLSGIHLCPGEAHRFMAFMKGENLREDGSPPTRKGR